MQNLIKKNQHIVFPLLDVLVSIFNYAFHILTSRYLIPNQYGVLNSLLSFLSILLVAGISFQIFTAKYISQNGNDKFFFKKLYNLSLSMSLVLLLILIFTSPLIKIFTRSNYTCIAITILIFISNIMVSIVRGILQGNQKFLILNSSFYIEVILKMAFLIIFMKIYPSIVSILLSILVGMITSLIHGLYYLNKFYKEDLDLKNIFFSFNFLTSINFKQDMFSISKIYFANIFFCFFTSIDGIIVNYKMADISGVYAVVLKYSQLLSFAAASVLTVIIPILSSKLKCKKSFMKSFYTYLAIAFCTSPIIVVFYYFILPSSVTMFFSSSYADAKNYLFLGVIPYTLLICILLIINTHIILENTKYLITLCISSIILTFSLLILATSLYKVFLIQTIIYFITMIVLLMQLMLPNCRKEF